VSHSPLVVLVVEDEWLLRQHLVDEFAAAGWSVLEAGSGESAVDFLRDGVRMDVLVTDIRLGTGMTGWEVADTFRRAHAQMPVVYVSANPSSDPRRVEGSVFLNKPCVVETLLATCRTLCAR
jgi:two-component system OmpR family response regulator